jgi:hypothetical protein
MTAMLMRAERQTCRDTSLSLDPSASCQREDEASGPILLMLMLLLDSFFIL